MKSIQAVLYLFCSLYFSVLSLKNDAYLMAAAAFVLLLIDCQIIGNLQNKLRLYKRIYTDLKDVVAGF